VPDEEEGGERDEADSGRFSEGETEEESLIDCGLKLRKVSFIEKVRYCVMCMTSSCWDTSISFRNSKYSNNSCFYQGGQKASL